MNMNFLILIYNLVFNFYKSIFQNVFAEEVSTESKNSTESKDSTEITSESKDSTEIISESKDSTEIILEQKSSDESNEKLDDHKIVEENKFVSNTTDIVNAVSKEVDSIELKESVVDNTSKTDTLSINTDNINLNLDQKIYAYDKQLGFQDAYTPIMEGIINLHHDILTWLVAIVIFILWLIIRTVSNFYHTNNRYSTEIQHNESIILEIIWTIIPSIVLLSIAIPSFALLYSIDEIIDPVLTIKVVGYQWYWEYEYPDFNQNQLVFQSYMINEADLLEGELRLLEVDNRLVIPTNMHIRILITANDVLHSWAVPSLGVKMDAVPGRLNQISLFCKKTGIYYGQCSEICGVNHGFMPIVVESIPFNDFIRWFNFKINQA